MTYRDRLIAKRMIDLKELATKYSVKINEKGSKATAVDKILKKMDEVFKTEFTDKEIKEIKADLDNGVTLTAALEKARDASYNKPYEPEEETEDTGVPAELAETEKPIIDKPSEKAVQKTSENTEGKKVKPKKGVQLEFNGKSQNICAWAKELGISANTLYGRIYKMGWSVEKAFTTPARSARNNKA